MKKGIVILFALCCMNLLGAEYQNNLADIHTQMNLSRGEEQFRANVIFKDMGIAGRSNSNQYIDYVRYAKGHYNPGAKYDETKSFMLGTNSNLVKHPNFFAGISLGNFKSYLKTDETKYKVRSLGFNYFVGYNLDNTLFITKLGYNNSKNRLENMSYKTNNWLLAGEVGHIYKLNDSNRLYPFVTIGTERHVVKSHHNTPKFKNNVPNAGAGLNLTSIIKNKVQISTTAKWNSKLKEEKYHITKTKTKKLPKNYGEVGVQLGYFVDEDFLVTLGYRYLFDKNYKYNLVNIGLSHNF